MGLAIRDLEFLFREISAIVISRNQMRTVVLFGAQSFMQRHSNNYQILPTNGWNLGKAKSAANIIKLIIVSSFIHFCYHLEFLIYWILCYSHSPLTRSKLDTLSILLFFGLQFTAVARNEEPWGKKMIIKYRLSVRGRAILSQILEPYEALFPRHLTKDEQ